MRPSVALHPPSCSLQGIDNAPGVHPALQPRRRRGRPRTKGLPTLPPGQVMTLEEALKVRPHCSLLRAAKQHRRLLLHIVEQIVFCRLVVYNHTIACSTE